MDEPLRSLFRYINKYRDDNSEEDYELRTVFPIVKYLNDESRTLRELGLYPKRALSMHYIEQEQIFIEKSQARETPYADTDSEF
jgi:hypothetical protein